ncbi:hypothetical protein LKMONMHP_0487 [Methylobacterium organophilum]|uniref:DUF2628 domain-containing protein n=2 Tax=Methylobacterium organophilum TaxID=410 RepID=A0ABQ4T3Z6_METOR|nr:hypothetical protein LKMONMHP_0487 [Methylobacterium organophilum]
MGLRMRTYTLHLPEGALRGDARALDRAHMVPDGFSWPAFAFTALWFFFHRLWLAGALVLAFLVALAVGGRLLGLTPWAGILVSLLAAILIGLEAASLRRWTYARNGRPARDAVIAASSEEAEAKAVARWLDPAGTGIPVTVRPAARRRDEEVIGLFPASEGSR